MPLFSAPPPAPPPSPASAPAHAPAFASSPSSLRELNPSVVRILPPSASRLSSHSLISLFRESGTYIARHQSRTFVLHLPGQVLQNEAVLSKMCDDLSLLWLLGMKLILVIGCRDQVDQRLKKLGQEWESHEGVRVTTQEILRLVKEEAGFGRFEVERNLARALKNAGLGVTSKGEGGEGADAEGGVSGGNCVSGNFITAQPLGVRSGVDYMYTGVCRRVETSTIRRALDARDIVLVSSLGVSPSGEMFNIASESLAATIAGAMGADKVIYYLSQPGNLHLFKTPPPATGGEGGGAAPGTETFGRGKVIQSLRLANAKSLLKYHGVTMKPYSVQVPDTLIPGSLEREMLEKMGWCFSALSSGVKRAHMISPSEGSLLLEMFTRDGSGTMISRDLYDGIRRATVEDISGIYKVVEPLVLSGNLVSRPRDVMEKEIGSYYVYTRDDMIVACGQLRRWEEGFAEIGCLAVHEDYRKSGRGDAMLSYLERLCVDANVHKMFVMSTQTMQWFAERGFSEVPLDQLPDAKRANVDCNRNSKVFLKEITHERELDTEELIWDR
ncbi:hypothetical protein TeGR_g12381 [Tetraparma gracilis]|uniref:amino-acid N-acetyltransferase n=1 Tax=Tetraparma gracilis TaxID=2962635 RepID=A0ABQ6MWE1_9STRA|nr:hypothetical protein TeGR_g12381 [Tetraparma gracilis]